MRADACLIVGPTRESLQAASGGDLAVAQRRAIRRMVHSAPIGWRQTADAVYLVGTSASPVGDDRVAANIEVCDGGDLALRSSAASIAWRGRGEGSLSRFDITVGHHASLDWRPEPTVATSGCSHRSEYRVALTATSRLWWEEQVVLGRTGERAGRIVSALDVDVDGAGLLRHTLAAGCDATGAAMSEAPSILGVSRAVGLILVAKPGIRVERSGGEGWAVMPLAGPAVLGLALADDSPGLQARMAEVRSHIEAAG